MRSVTMAPPAPATERAGGAARAFVAAFLSIFLVCGLFGVEAWPFSGFRLFSASRPRVLLSWEASGVDASGREAPLPFGQLPAAYRGFLHVLKGFPELPAGEQARVCAAWGEAAGVETIRIYRTRRDLAARDGARGAPAHRSLAYTCARGGVTEA